MKANVVREKSYSFAVRIVRFCRKQNDPTMHPLITQLLRSGTSVAANIEEASAAQSRNDFLTKMCIASKEARETSFWLRLLRDSDCISGSAVNELNADAQELIRILTAIVKTTRQKQPVVLRNSKFKIQNSKLASSEAPS